MKQTILFFLAIGATAFAQVAATTAQPLARDASTYNLNRTRLDFGSGQELRFESGSTFTLQDGTTFSIGTTAKADFISALGVGFGSQSVADSAALTAATPAAAGQIALQRDTGGLYWANSATTGDWGGEFAFVRVATGDGTVSLPAMRFAADGDTGIYRIGAGQIGVAIDGTKRFELNTESLRLPDGTEAAPGLSFTGDTNVGIYRSGADTLDFVTGGATRFKVTDGQVYFPSGTEANPGLADMNFTGTGIWTTGEGDIAFSVLGAEAFRVDSGGGVTFAGILTADTIIGTRHTKVPLMTSSPTEPNLRHESATNTGIYFPDASQVGISVSGSSRFLVTSTTTTISDLTLSTPLSFANGGSGATTIAAARLQPTEISLREEFIGGNSTSGQIGELGWSQVNYSGTGTFAGVAATSTGQGLFTITTATASGNHSGVVLANSSQGGIYNPCATDFRMAMRFSVSASTLITARAGIIGDASSTTTTATVQNGIYIRYDTASGDTNWMYCTTSGGTTTATNSGVAFDTGVHTFLIRRISGSSVAFSIDGGAETTVATNVPTTAGMAPTFRVLTNTTAAKAITADFFGWESTR